MSLTGCCKKNLCSDSPCSGGALSTVRGRNPPMRRRREELFEEGRRRREEEEGGVVL